MERELGVVSNPAEERVGGLWGVLFGGRYYPRLPGRIRPYLGAGVGDLRALRRGHDRQRFGVARWRRPAGRLVGRRRGPFPGPALHDRGGQPLDADPRPLERVRPPDGIRLDLGRTLIQPRRAACRRRAPAVRGARGGSPTGARQAAPGQRRPERVRLVGRDHRAPPSRRGVHRMRRAAIAVLRSRPCDSRACRRGRLREHRPHRAREPRVPHVAGRLGGARPCRRSRTRPPREPRSSASRSASCPAIARPARTCRRRTRPSWSARGPPSPPPPGGQASRSCSAPSASSTVTARITALVVDRDGAIAGFQDKVQLDPSEEGPYVAGLRAARLPVGAAHVRRRHLPRGLALSGDGPLAAARQGAHVVFHPHFHEAEPGSYRPTTFADPANTFHEKAALCRAAENTC